MAWGGLEELPSWVMDSRGYIRKKFLVKDEKGSSLIRWTLEKFQRQCSRNFWEMGWSVHGLFWVQRIPSWTQLYWSGFMAWKGSGRVLHKVDVKYSLTVLLTLTLFTTLETSWLCSWQGVSHLAMGCYMTSCWNSDCSYFLVSDRFFK